MSKQFAFLFGLAVAAGIWVVGPMLRPDLAQTWFAGMGQWQSMVLHGNDVAAIAVGLAVWIVALHFPRRPRRIAGIRHGVDEPLPWPPKFA